MLLCRVGILGAAAFLLIAPHLHGEDAELAGKVIDENGVAVSSAKLTLEAAGALFATTSDEAGRFLLPSIPAGTYAIRVEKPGYYAYVGRAFGVLADSGPVEIVLNHMQEFEETVSVAYSAPVIDRQEVAAQRTVSAEEIIEMPYPATHDFRSALPLLPGIVRDNAGRVHLNGGAENQSYYTLDGFNFANPASGELDNRVSVDAIRAIRAETSRYSAEHGKGSAGVLALETSRGDDHFRFLATNFLPSFEFRPGLTLSGWTPRVNLSGPIVPGRAWFFNALDFQYDLNLVDELPKGENSNANWHGANLSRVQVNLNPRNQLTTGLLVNFTESRHLGISPLDPLETSRDLSSRYYLFTVKDQAYLGSGWVLDVGAALGHLNSRERPMGRNTYVISPEGRSGNYFRESREDTERIQGIANVMVRPLQWMGHHYLKFGVDANRIRYRQFSLRHGVEILREDGSRARAVHFTGNPSFGRDNSEFSAFMEDRWSAGEQFVLEAGLRLDRDQILRATLASPRLALTYTPRQLRESKFSAGVGVFYDASNISMLTRSLDQVRSDTFYSHDGMEVTDGPVFSRYQSDERRLRAPAFINWSLGWEQKLPRSVYFSTNFIRKHGWNGWAYDLAGESAPTGPRVATYALGIDRRDSYYSLEFSARRIFWEKYSLGISYTRSSARSTQAVDFSIENPVFSRQGEGPLDWDAPNRLISYGSVPAPYFRKWLISYFLEWHSGLPYSVVNEGQQMVGPPNSRRFPQYFSLNLHAERRIRFWRTEWALRAGFNNITGNSNPTTINNNADSPDFGQYGGGEGRAFTGRIRFLGRN
jgi:hypothetical protein